MISKKVLIEYLHCGIKTTFGLILATFLKKKCKNQELWIVSERGNDARDNGYVFFEYLSKKHPEINAVYVINKQSVDFEKVKKLGRIVKTGSLEHYAMIFIASKLISTHVMGYTPCSGFFMSIEKRKKILPGDKIFLQHGIIKDNIDGLKYPNISVDLFICGAKPEYDYILNNYNYPDKIVQYTGLARYDNLLNNNVKKQILLMPTWRKWINSFTLDEFKESEYYQRYQSLLSNDYLDSLLQKCGYKLVFYPHYEIQKFISCFSCGKNVIIADFDHYDVSALLKESEILITDYSSVYFDFAYMEKPILYYQFDKEKFFSGHYSKGYFDETTFGYVLEDEKELINILSKIIYGEIDNSKYLENIRAFFKFHDCSNCDRIFSAILNIR